MFLRPSSAHYTYHPNAAPARDQRAYKDLPASFFNGVGTDFDLVPPRDYHDERDTSGVSLRRQRNDDMTPEARYARAMQEARAAQEELRAQAEEARLRDEARVLKEQVAQLRAERMREEARLNQLRREESRLAEVMRAEAHAVQVARERERRAAEEAQQEARRRELIARRRAALQQQEQARAAVRQLFTASARSQAPPPQPQQHRRHVTLADLLGRSVAPQKPAQDRSEPAQASAPAVRAESTREKPSDQANMKEVYDFISSLFGPQVALKQDKQSASNASVPTPQDKGKGKAAPQPASVPAPIHNIVQQRLEERLARETEQEMADTARAILNSLRDQGGASSAHATSSKVTVEHAPKPTSTSSADSKPAPSPRSASPVPSAAVPAAPLERIQSINDTLVTLRTSFHFPATPDFDRAGGLAYSPANTPVRAYEHALNGLLEQLDGIDSAGDEAVRGRRREVVKEVERALEELDERVRTASPMRVASPTSQAVELEEKVEKIAVEVDEKVAEEQEGKQEKQDEGATVGEQPELIAEEVAHPAEKPVDDQTTTHVAQEEPAPAEASTPDASEPLAVSAPDSHTVEEPSVADVLADTSAEDDAPLNTHTEAVPEALASAEPLATDTLVSNNHDSAHVQESIPVEEEQPATVGQLPVNEVSAESVSTHDIDIAPTSDTPTPLSDTPVSPRQETDPARIPSTPSSPALEQLPDPSDSFLGSLSHDHSRPVFPPASDRADAQEDDELEDSVLIEKEEHASDRSWSDVESDSA